MADFKLWNSPKDYPSYACHMYIVMHAMCQQSVMAFYTSCFVEVSKVVLCYLASFIGLNLNMKRLLGLFGPCDLPNS